MRLVGDDESQCLAADSRIAHRGSDRTRFAVEELAEGRRLSEFCRPMWTGR